MLLKSLSLCKTMKSRNNNFLSKFLLGDWNVGIANQDFISLLSNVKVGGTIVLDVKWMKHHHRNSFFADPFVFEVGENSISILAEEFFFDRIKGVISQLTIDRNTAKLLKKTVVLEESCHLSYPFYDKEFGTFIPESFRNGVLSEYAFISDTAKLQSTFINAPLIDATPVQHNGNWYVFATTQPNALDELLIYWSDKREGPYKAHPLNPQKKDIKTSRCGGKFFEYDGNLFRPVQDSTHIYGETIHIMRIKELSPTSFKEEFFCDVKIANTGPYSMGFHTLNFQDGVTVVDGFRSVFRPFQVIHNIKIAPLFRKRKHADY